jgi:hypothetical protein
VAKLWYGIVVVAVAAVGCGGHSGPYYGPPPPGPTLPPSTPTYNIALGAGITVAVGSQAGYGITASAGGNYRMVWTGDANNTGLYSSFTGTVNTPGSFSVFSPGCSGACTLESGDVIDSPVTDSSGGQYFQYDTSATTGLDGIDFTVTMEPVYFELYVNGAADPTLVFFPDASQGGAQATPSAIPFELQGA